jgi:hypothetical protein
MEKIDDRIKASKTLRYDITEPSVVFRIAWYVVASQPGVLLSEYSEPESKVFKGKATFTTTTGGVKARLQLSVDEAQRSIEMTAFGGNQAVISRYVNDLAGLLESSLRKYRNIPDKEKNKLRRALVAKTCWDKVVYEVLNKSPLSEIYVDLSHGREMMVQATEGEEMHPLTLTTEAWLTRIESLPRDQTLPADIATELAKKTIEWKKETHTVISRYLQGSESH